MLKTDTERISLMVQKKYGQSIMLNNQKIDTYLVIGTLSSGKSTFLNSLIGFELFPSKNTACTAKIFSYYGNPEINYFLSKNNKSRKPVLRKSLGIKQVEGWNDDKKVVEVEIEGPVNREKKKSFAIVDTPGPNNSMDKSHEQITKKALNDSVYKKIIHLLNATQIGVEDDQRLIQLVKEHVNLKDIIFVVNKADMIDDTEQENLQILSRNVSRYLNENGFEKPVIYFVSAAAAVLADKVQSDILLTRRESVTYRRFEETMKIDLAGYNVNNYISSIIENEDVSTNNLVWKNSGIQAIINLL